MTETNEEFRKRLEDKACMHDREEKDSHVAAIRDYLSIDGGENRPRIRFDHHVADRILKSRLIVARTTTELEADIDHKISILRKITAKLIAELDMVDTPSDPTIGSKDERRYVYCENIRGSHYAHIPDIGIVKVGENGFIDREGKTLLEIAKCDIDMAIHQATVILNSLKFIEKELPNLT